MWLAKTGLQARAEFIAWQAHVGEHRFHVPLWAAHEFFKHRLKGTVSSELAKEIKAFDSASKGLYEKLRVYCSDQLFGFKNSGRLFLDEYRRTVQPIRAMLQVAKGSDQFDEGVQHIATYVDAHLLPGPLGEIVNEIDADERVRNRGVIPPAFKDAHKQGSKRGAESDGQLDAGDNSFGDLALWREVLRHAAGVRAGALILLTADRKNDWFENDHGLAGVGVEVHKRIVRPRPVPTPHPLLVREAFDRGAGDLTLLDPMYCGVLLEREGGSYANFAAAALDAQLPDPERKPRAVLSWARRFGAETSLFGELAEFETSEVEGAAFDTALLDIGLLNASSEISVSALEVIQQINNGDLAGRAAVFNALDLEAIAQWEVAAVIALGRATLRAAEAEDPSALELLSRLRDYTPEFPLSVLAPFYFGALGAIYFEDNLDPRLRTGSQASVILLSMATLPELTAAAQTLAAGMDHRPLLYRPGESEPLEFHIVVQPSANNKSPADLIAIKLNGTDLMTSLQTDEALRFTTLLELPAGEADIALGALLELITRFHLLPRHLVKSDTDLDTSVHVPEYAGIELDL